jgi:hypothetical protein
VAIIEHNLARGFPERFPPRMQRILVRHLEGVQEVANATRRSS